MENRSLELPLMLSSEMILRTDEKEGLAYGLESEHAAVFTPVLHINPGKAGLRGQNECKI